MRCITKIKDSKEVKSVWEAGVVVEGGRSFLLSVSVGTFVCILCVLTCRPNLESDFLPVFPLNYNAPSHNSVSCLQ